MLPIPAEQLARLDAHFADERIELIRDHVEEHFPDEYAELIAPDPHHTVIHQAVETGSQYDLTTDSNLIIFTDFRLVFGPDFPDDQPWATDILLSDELSEDEKTEQLVDYLANYIEPDDN